MVKLAEDRISRKGRLGPGQMIAVDLGEGRFYDQREIMDTLARATPITATGSSTSPSSTTC